MCCLHTLLLHALRTANSSLVLRHMSRKRTFEGSYGNVVVPKRVCTKTKCMSHAECSECREALPASFLFIRFDRASKYENLEIHCTVYCILYRVCEVLFFFGAVCCDMIRLCAVMSAKCRFTSMRRARPVGEQSYRPLTVHGARDYVSGQTCARSPQR